MLRSMTNAIAFCCGFFLFTLTVALPVQALAAEGATQANSGSGIILLADGRDRVCCKRGRRDWFTTRRSCRRSGGYIVRDRACRRGIGDRPGNDRVCCKRGRRDYFTSRRGCRRDGGRIIRDRFCFRD